MKIEEGNLSHGSGNLGKSECREIFLFMKMKDGCVSTASEIEPERQPPPREEDVCRRADAYEAECSGEMGGEGQGPGWQVSVSV